MLNRNDFKRRIKDAKQRHKNDPNFHASACYYPRIKKCPCMGDTLQRVVDDPQWGYDLKRINTDYFFYSLKKKHYKNWLKEMYALPRFYRSVIFNNAITGRTHRTRLDYATHIREHKPPTLYRLNRP